MADKSMHYRGGKGRAYREIINLIPPHDCYVETHLGAGAVLRHKRPSAATIGIDIDPVVIAKWRTGDCRNLTILLGD